MNAETQKNIMRIETIWREARAKFGRDGAFLFGEFSAAVAMYVPVVMRFMTYQPTLNAIHSPPVKRCATIRQYRRGRRRRMRKLNLSKKMSRM